METILPALFAASGCAALIYEIVWFHLMRLVIGASALSLGIVLASFMGGMFLGSLLLSRVVSTTRHALVVYAVLEIGIGLFGLVLPILMPAARAVYFGLFGYGALGIAVRALVAALLLLPPTALMGATLPAIARRYARSEKSMSSLAVLYGANTGGAVLGCMLTGFYLLPNWDVVVATVVAATLNFAIGAVALWLWSRTRDWTPPAQSKDTSAAPTSRPHAVYIAIALSGMTALGAQVVWTRLLALLFGGTTYTFAIILAVFLGGIGLGSALAAGALRRGSDSRELLAACQLGLIPTIAYAATMIAKVTPYSATLRMVPIHIVHVIHTIHCIEVILPAAILWGMSFPLALAAAGSGHGDAGKSSGEVYAANTVGAIVGALAISFVAIPRWGTRASEQILVATACVSAVVMYRALYKTEEKTQAKRDGDRFSPAFLLALFAIPIGIVGVRAVPALAPAFQASGRYLWNVSEKDKYPYVAEGIASTVAVREGAGRRYYHVAGKVEASTDPSDMRLQRLLGHLTALVHPKPESVLVVGLGAGVTAGTFVMHPEVKRIVICEIEPRVVPAAAGFFAQENHNVLSDPRVEVIYDDARHFLATTHETFDIVTSDPIHPWVRGNSVLFSREYYAIVKERLRPGGVAAQWVPLYETSEPAIKIQMRTFLDAFPNGTVWNSQTGGRGYDVVVLGQAAPTRIDVANLQRRIEASPDLKKSLSDANLGSAVDLLGSYAIGSADLAGWLEGTPVNRDMSLKLEYISGLALNLQKADEIYRSMVGSQTYPDGLFDASPEIVEQLKDRIFPKAPKKAP